LQQAADATGNKDERNATPMKLHKEIMPVTKNRIHLSANPVLKNISSGS
jgi:hypothetical protein